MISEKTYELVVGNNRYYYDKGGKQHECCLIGIIPFIDEYGIVRAYKALFQLDENTEIFYMEKIDIFLDCIYAPTNSIGVILDKERSNDKTNNDFHEHKRLYYQTLVMMVCICNFYDRYEIAHFEEEKKKSIKLFNLVADKLGYETLEYDDITHRIKVGFMTDHTAAIVNNALINGVLNVKDNPYNIEIISSEYNKEHEILQDLLEKQLCGRGKCIFGTVYSYCDKEWLH